MAVYPIRPGPVRTTTQRGGPNMEVGSMISVSVDTTVLQSIENISGDDLLPIILDAIEPSMEIAKSQWPVLTGASIESFEVTGEVTGERKAHGQLQVGGAKLISDSRNDKHIDYAPFIEFNGSPTGLGKDAVFNSFVGRADEMKRMIRDGVQRLIAERMK